MATLKQTQQALQTVKCATSARDYQCALRTVNEPNSAVSAALMRAARTCASTACAVSVALHMCAVSAPNAQTALHYRSLAAQTAHYMGV